MSTIQFNLLPDVKAQYISTARNRRIVTLVSSLVTGISIVVFILSLLTVKVVQKKQLDDANKDINSAVSQLKNMDGLSKAVTINNQLQTLASLHQSDHSISRIFVYMPQLTPATASIANLSLDLNANTLNITGTADSQATVNSFVDTLKLATYSTGAGDSGHSAFSSVILTGFSATPGSINYSISAQFDPVLFSNPQGSAPVISVKNQLTTRLNPDSLFGGGK